MRTICLKQDMLCIASFSITPARKLLGQHVKLQTARFKGILNPLFVIFYINTYRPLFSGVITVNLSLKERKK